MDPKHKLTQMFAIGEYDPYSFEVNQTRLVLNNINSSVDYFFEELDMFINEHDLDMFWVVERGRLLDQSHSSKYSCPVFSGWELPYWWKSTHNNHYDMVIRERLSDLAGELYLVPALFIITHVAKTLGATIPDKTTWVVQRDDGMVIHYYFDGVSLFLRFIAPDPMTKSPDTIIITLQDVLDATSWDDFYTIVNNKANGS